MSNIVIARPQVEIDEAVRQLLITQAEECTIVHCRYFSNEPTGVRIWPTTFLIEDSGRRSKLIKNLNISLMPEWTFHLEENQYIRFTLVFEALSKDCSFFYLLEEIQQPFNFYSHKTACNRTGVYNIEVFCS